MADTAADAPAAAAPTPKKVAKPAKAKKPAAKPDHPAFSDMIVTAVKELKERSGSSRHAILKYIMAHYKVEDEKKANTKLKKALAKGVESGSLKQVKGTGASGSFKVNKDAKPEKVAKPKAAKKSPAKKPKTDKKPKAAKKAATPKKAAKKPAAKKAATPKKAAKKPAAKKATPKKAAKKPAAKKPVAKTAKKPAAKKASKK